MFRSESTAGIAGPGVDISSRLGAGDYVVELLLLYEGYIWFTSSSGMSELIEASVGRPGTHRLLID